MKKYTNIPLKERKRNADRCYRHEAKLEEIKAKREMREKMRFWEQQNEEIKSDKEQMEADAFARLKALERSEG